ncbi:MAG: GAF domain-containing protein [Candidatus Bathyarchaeia archaeon]|nr:GAF domain-containing protein [Candidatus Bathyarchaeota archaeon]
MIQICEWKFCKKECPKVRIWATLASINKTLHSLDRRKILTTALNWLNNTLKLNGCAIKLFGNEEELNLITIGAIRKNDLNGLPEPNIKNALNEPLTLKLKSSTLIVFPIICKTKVFGIIYVCPSETLTDEELSLIKELSECIGVALENERKYKIAMKNWYDAIEELWSKINVWETCEKPQERKIF